MLTYMGIATFDEWPWLARYFATNGQMPLFLMLLVFLAVFGLGVMNLALGVMCTASLDAVRTTEKQRIESRFRAVLDMSRALSEEMGEFVERGEMGEQVITRRTFNRFRAVLAKAAELTPDELNVIYSRLEVDGSLDVRTFIQGCLCNKVPITNVDLLQLSTAIRKLREVLLSTFGVLEGLHINFIHACQRIDRVAVGATPRSFVPKSLDPYGALESTGLSTHSAFHTPRNAAPDARVTPLSLITSQDMDIDPDMTDALLDWDSLSQADLFRALDEAMEENRHLRQLQIQLDLQVRGQDARHESLREKDNASGSPTLTGRS